MTGQLQGDKSKMRRIL